MPIHRPPKSLALWRFRNTRFYNFLNHPSERRLKLQYHVTQTNQSEDSIRTTWHKPTNQNTVSEPRDTNQPIRREHQYHVTQTEKNIHRPPKSLALWRFRNTRFYNFLNSHLSTHSWGLCLYHPPRETHENVLNRVISAVHVIHTS
jgi:hypothetical protein